MSKTTVHNKVPVPLRKEIKKLANPKNGFEWQRKLHLEDILNSAKNLLEDCNLKKVGNFRVKSTGYQIILRRLRK